MAAVQSESKHYPDLHRVALTYPAIDNHAHPLLREEHRDSLPFEGLISEAEGGALTEDAIYTVACLRATKELATLYHLPEDSSWDALKSHRKTTPYSELCNSCFDLSNIHCVLLDDGLGGVAEFAEGYQWHDQFTRSPSKRIVRVEIVAEKILQALLEPHRGSDTLDVTAILAMFTENLRLSLTESASNENVTAFKSIICYRTGLDIAAFPAQASLKFSLLDVFKMYRVDGHIRLAHKALNDHVVRLTLEIAGERGLPVQFHTGLGDNDITLVLSSPSRMQPIIKVYPKTKFILLHSSYPYTREAGYLTAVYANVFLDFGEIFPFVSRHGQKTVIRQVLELCPTNKVMWSSDGHWWPESFYLGASQARQVLYDVLSEMIMVGDLSEGEAIKILQRVLFHNANGLYKLGLQVES